MTKREQQKINGDLIERVFTLTRNIKKFGDKEGDIWYTFYVTVPLYHCQASIVRPCEFFKTKYGAELPNVIILESYSRFIALYDYETSTLFDFLRYTYGYSSTSQRHIEKFRKWLCENGYTVKQELRWRMV